jgi:hypothetical protein
MKAVIIAGIILLAAFGSAFAQQDPDDPGAQDSIIIGTVQVDYGTPEVQVPVYLFADDPVSYINIPTGWNTAGGINPIEVIDMDQNDCFSISYTIFADFIRILCGNDLSDTSCTQVLPDDSRLNLFSIVFSIAPDAPAQQVAIDTTWDDRAHSVIFGLADGITEITPAAVGGEITYGPLGINADADNLPDGFKLSQNYPNPFNASTNVAFSLSQEGRASLTIFDLLGRRVRGLLDKNLQSGSYQITWDGKDESGMDVPSGAYFYRLMAGSNEETKRMTLIR